MDYDAQIRSLFDVDPSAATPAQRRRVLNDMIREELFVQRGLELDMPSVDPDVRGALVSAVEAQVAADALTKQPTEAELRAYYLQHQDKYASFGVMTVRDLVAAGKFSADPRLLQAVQALRQGGAPDAVAARYGLKDSGKVSGEEYYFAARIHLGDLLFNAARALPSGGASDPIVQPDGVHILAMVKNVAPQPIAFEAARAQVLDDDRRESSARLEKGDEVFLRKRANILIAEDLK
jgi:parvulin-like peptidyl-prolyl isomerase